MKTFKLLLLVLLAFSFANAQSQSKVENYPLKAMDVVIFPFGIENPLMLGTISDSGDINFNIPMDLSAVPKEAQGNSMSDVAYTILSVCDNGFYMISENENIPSVEAGFISLQTKDKRYAGVLFMVSDEALVPYIDDMYSNAPVLGSFYELIYVVSDFNFNGECTATQDSENGGVESTFTFNLNLKAGFNFIEFKIESITEFKIETEEPNVFYTRYATDKVSITSTQSTVPKIKWIGRYF